MDLLGIDYASTIAARYGDGAGNTDEVYSSVFSLILMR